MLLKNGEQTLKPKFTFAKDISISSLETDAINGFDLTKADNYLTFDGEDLLFNSINTLTIDEFEIDNIDLSDIHIVEDGNPEFVSKSEIDVKEFMTLSMKDNGDQIAKLNYRQSGLRNILGCFGMILGSIILGRN